MRAVAGVAALTLVLVGALFIGFGDSDPAPVELTTVDLLATTTGAVSEEGEEESSESEGVDEAPSSSSSDASESAAAVAAPRSAGAAPSTAASVGAAGQRVRTPPSGVVWHEPEGFEVVIDEDWSTFDTYGWWHTPTNRGSAELVDGRLVWTFPAGKKGGSVPGAKIVVEDRRHGPYQYHRDEGVTLSENFHGHRSSVNKFRYFNDSSASGSSPIIFSGTDDGPLSIGINSLWAGPHYDSRLRWNSPGNLASASRTQALVTRGTPHTIETLLYIGTQGNNDGWIKLWLDGELILHFRDLGVVRADKGESIRGVHFAPVWGGTGDEVPQTMTLTMEHSYVSTGSSAPSL